jgi:hypothetical protein
LVTGSLFLILIVLIILGVWSLLRAGRWVLYSNNNDIHTN